MTASVPARAWSQAFAIPETDIPKSFLMMWGQPWWREKGVAPPWFFTSSVYAESSLEGMTLSDDQYRDIGFALVARLFALNGRLPE